VVRGRNIPTDASENFDPSGLIRIYREKEERERRQQAVASLPPGVQGLASYSPGFINNANE
jgi:hypothetical protein